MSETASQPADALSAGGPPRGRARAARGVTRERILDVAMDLFNEQGYDKTSLREIAQRLGITKAALYYHFERKEDILLELHLRLHALGRELIERFDSFQDEQQALAAWPDLLDHFIDQVLANRDLFLLHQRNHAALQVLADNERHRAEGDDVAQRVYAFLGNASVPVADRVRMACSLGAVFSALMGASALFGDVPADELARQIRGVLRDLFPASVR